MKSWCAAVLIGVILLSSLMIALRGAAPELFRQEEIPGSDVQTSIVSYNYPTNGGWSFTNFTADEDNWLRYNNNTTSSLDVGSGMLSLSTVFDQGQPHQWVRITRPLDINISELPIFYINISVSRGAIFDIRFDGMALTANGSWISCPVWWETSPLDGVPGTSNWEIHEVDLVSFSEHEQQIIGVPVSIITNVSIILDKPFSLVSGEKQLAVSSLGFYPRIFNVAYVNENTGADLFSNTGPFQAVVINLPQQYQLNSAWNLRWVSVTYTLTSSVPSEYQMFLLSQSTGLVLLAQGTTFASHSDSSPDIYRLDAVSYGGIPSSEQLMLIQQTNLLGKFSIVILKDGSDQGNFDTFSIASLELSYSRVIPGGS